MTTFLYRPSQVLCDKEFIDTGSPYHTVGPVNAKLTAPRQIVIDDATLMPEDRALIVAFRKLQGQGFGMIELGRMAIFHSFPFSMPSIRVEPVLWDYVPTAEIIMLQIGLMLEDYALIESDWQAQVNAWQVQHERVQAKAQAERDRITEESRQQQIQREQDRLAASVINWKPDGTAICNLMDVLYSAADLNPDTRFANWVKEVVAVNRQREGGYMYDGDFLMSGTVEIKRKPHVYLVTCSHGSRRHKTTEYRVVLMDGEGVLHRTEIATDNSTLGWALRLRDQIQALLVTLK